MTPTVRLTGQRNGDHQVSMGWSQRVSHSKCTLIRVDHAERERKQTIQHNEPTNEDKPVGEILLYRACLVGNLEDPGIAPRRLTIQRNVCVLR